ncbi:MAG: hypothetical protein ILO68_01675, partial [Clostridia bacterium]|nr:hypothetical protein [Clostridia bacterium]
MKQQKQTDIFEKHIRTLRNLIDRLENPKERPSFNFSDPSDRKALRTIYLDRVAETIRCRRSHFSVKSFESLLRLQRRYLDKRFASSADFFASESGDLLDRLSDRNPVRDLVSFFGSVPDHATYSLDFSYRYSLAAAIWILDALNEEGNLAKALTVLWEYSDDADEDFIESRIPENLTDPRFDRKTIACMLYLIEHRNDDLQEKDEGDIWISPATLKRAAERHEYP